MESDNNMQNGKSQETKMIAEKLDSFIAGTTKNIRKLSDQKNLVKDLTVNLEKRDFFLILRTLEKGAIKELRTAFPELNPTLTQLEEIAKKEVEPRVISFDKDFRENLAKLELRREWWYPEVIAGKFPEYTINKMIRVIVDNRTMSATVNGQVIEDLNVQRISSKITSENNRLFGRLYNSQRFAEQLYTAYETTCLKNKKNVGDVVHLKEVYRTILFQIQKPQFFDQPTKLNLQQYLPDEFIVDLSRYIKNDATSIRNGMRLELHPLRDSRDALYITMPNGEQVYRGLISFTRLQA